MEKGRRFIVSSDRLEKPGIKPATPVYQAREITTAPRRFLVHDRGGRPKIWAIVLFSDVSLVSNEKERVIFVHFFNFWQ